MIPYNVLREKNINVQLHYKHKQNNRNFALNGHSDLDMNSIEQITN